MNNGDQTVKTSVALPDGKTDVLLAAHQTVFQQLP